MVMLEQRPSTAFVPRSIPSNIPNWIGGEQRPAAAGESVEKKNPVDGCVLWSLARSRAADIAAAVSAARKAQLGWADQTPVTRGTILNAIADAMEVCKAEIAQIVALETGKSFKAAVGETDGAIALARFYAGEGQRLYGRTTTSGTPNKMAMTIRQPVGVAALIVAANTPIANVAWKVFPALICGNAAILKAAEDTPAVAWLFGAIAHQAGLPPGVLSIVQGLGPEAGEALISHDGVSVISFTGSTAVGRHIAEVAGRRLAKLSLELGGKNPLVVCDDADLDNALNWSLLSAFSNAGQRCASGSRLIIFDAVYDAFRDQLVRATAALRVGPADDDDLGPVINERQLTNMIRGVQGAVARGARILVGGDRLTDAAHHNGYYMAPTLVENVALDDELSTTELFGPIAILYRVKDFGEALEVANHSPYGLTAAIHTSSIDRALEFAKRVQAGVAVVNGGTYGSEPHMPFGGVKQSGNGSREPGTEALDIYSDLKNLYLFTNPQAV